MSLPMAASDSSKAAMPSEAVKAAIEARSRRPSKAESSSKRARTTLTAKDPEERYGSEMMFVVHSGLEFTINAVDKTGALIPSYCITSALNSVPCFMGFTLIGSDLHMFGGLSTVESQYSLYTYTLDLRKIPYALEHGPDLFELLVRSPRKMIHQKVSPVVMHVRNRIYVLAAGIHGRSSEIKDFEYRRFEPESAWFALKNPPVPCEWKGTVGIESHAIIGDHSIVISLMCNRGVYVFSIDSHTWTSVETGPLCFIGQPVSLPGGNGIYISPSNSSLMVFDDVMSSPLRKLRIRKTSRCIRHSANHQVAVMGDVAFVIRCGSSTPDDYFRAVYITIDTYKVSSGCDRVTALDHSPALLLDDNYMIGPAPWLYCAPVRLSG